MPAPAGAYSSVAVWPSATAWFDAVMDVLATGDGETARRRAKVARDTLLRVAYADRQAADQRTGRGVATAHETVAVKLGMSAKTVQRARLLLEALGLAVTVVEGRYLTTAERAEATGRHGGYQVRAASTRALTLPASYRAPAPSAPRDAHAGAVESVHLPPVRGVNTSPHLLERSPTRAHSRTLRPTASRRAALTKSRRILGPEVPRGIEVQRLAAELVRRMPWLARERHIGVVCDLLDRLGVVRGGWTVSGLLDAIERHVATAGVRLAAIDDQRDPVAYLSWLLRSAVPEGTLSPTAVLGDERRERLVRQAAQLEADRAARARIAAEADSIQAIIDEMRATRGGSSTSSPSANR